MHRLDVSVRARLRIGASSTGRSLIATRSRSYAVRNFCYWLRQDRPENHPCQDGRNIPTWQGIDVRSVAKARSRARPASAIAVRSFTVKRSAGVSLAQHPINAASTNSAVGNAAENVLHLARAQFRVHSGDRREATQGSIGTLEPAHGALVIAQTFTGDGYDASQAVKPVGFVTCKPSSCAGAAANFAGKDRVRWRAP